MIRANYQGEYETWQLVNELVAAEKMYFDRRQERVNTKVYETQNSVCPKTLDYDSLSESHTSAVIHAVALWLEKIYEEDRSLQVLPLDLQQAQNRTDFEGRVPKDMQTQQKELQSLRALFQMLRAGKIQEA